MKKNNIAVSRKIRLMFIGLLLIGSFTASAQITLPGDGTVQDAPDAPIDGFVAVGLIAGACVGLRKHLKAKNTIEE